MKKVVKSLQMPIPPATSYISSPLHQRSITTTFTLSTTSGYLIMFLRRMSLFSHGGHLLVAAIKVLMCQVWLSAPRATCAGHHPRVQHHHLRDPARAEGAPGPGHLRLMVPGRPQARLLCWQRLPLRVECRHRWEYDKYTQRTDHGDQKLQKATEMVAGSAFLGMPVFGYALSSHPSCILSSLNHNHCWYRIKVPW